jgi:hypothetical protein
MSWNVTGPKVSNTNTLPRVVSEHAALEPIKAPLRPNLETDYSQDRPLSFRRVRGYFRHLVTTDWQRLDFAAVGSSPVSHFAKNVDAPEHG